MGCERGRGAGLHYPPVTRRSSYIAGVWVRITELRQYPLFERLHPGGCARALVIVSLQVQRAVDRQVRDMRRQRLALRARLAPHHRRAQHEVAREGLAAPAAAVAEAEYVGGVVLVAVIAVEPAAFGGADEAHGDRRALLEGGSQPAAKFGVRRQAGGAHR